MSRYAALGMVLCIAGVACGGDDRADFAPTPTRGETTGESTAGRSADRGDAGNTQEVRDAASAPVPDGGAARDAGKPVTGTTGAPDCEPCFEEATTFPLGFAPGDVAVADFDGDGTLDVAFQQSTSGSASLVSLMMADGVGGFDEVGPFEVGDGASAVVAGDFDGDGSPDVATSNYADGEDTLSVLSGDGAGGFAAAVHVTMSGRPFHLAAGDVDRDGRDDLVSANFSAGELGLVLGRADRAFASMVVGAIGDFPTRVCLGDADDDGNLDALASFEKLSFNLAYFRGDGRGGFAAAEFIETAAGTPWGCAVGDFDGSGSTDIIVAKRGAFRVNLLRGGADEFLLHGGAEAGDGPYEVAVGDFDRDGIADVAVSHDRDDLLLVLYGGDALTVDVLSMTETFFVRRENLAVRSPVDVIAADMNGDGRDDLVTASVLRDELVIFYAR